MTPLHLTVIIGSTRPNRFSETPARWIHKEAQRMNEGGTTDLIDLRDVDLPMFESPTSPSMIQDGNYGNDKVNAWAQQVAKSDAFIMVSPEYNHSTSAVLKNALDSVYHEWNNKAVGFVSYGSVGGARAVEHLRLIAVELQMAPVRNGVHIPADIHFPILFGKAEWTPETEEKLQKQADTMITQLLWWGRALKQARQSA